MKNFFIKIFCILLLSQATVAYSTPNITAKSWLVADSDGNILEGVNTKDIRSIASISKLMTAIVVLDSKQDLDEIINFRNLSLTRLDILRLAVVNSDNEAAMILCKTYLTGYQNCIHDMNKKAIQLGMHDTKFIEPTGLSIFNVSTATDLIKLVQAASNYTEIVNASKMEVVKVRIISKNKVLWQEFRNTNPLVATKNFIVSKTGFISKSGGCIVMMLETAKGIRTIILLGSQNTRTRIPEASLISRLY